MVKRILKFWVFCSLIALCGGCDPLTVHKVSATLFDGVPSLPPADQYCQDFHEQKTKEELELAKTKDVKTGKQGQGSAHPPYAAKECARCHDKTKEGGLILPKDKLCFHCHPKITAKAFVHGPASVGSCLECHDPHSSPFPALLKVEKSMVCASCHKETRQAAAMHEKVTANHMVCMDCHNPHCGDAPFFLR